MGSDDFFVDPDGLANSSQAFTERGAQVQRLADRIHALTDQARLTRAAGNDHAGEQFLGSHLPGARDLHEAVSTWGDTVRATGDSLKSTADMFRTVENTNTDAAKHLRTQLAATGGGSGSGGGSGGGSGSEGGAAVPLSPRIGRLERRSAEPNTESDDVSATRATRRLGRSVTQYSSGPNTDDLSTPTTGYGQVSVAGMPPDSGPGQVNLATPGSPDTGSTAPADIPAGELASPLLPTEGHAPTPQTPGLPPIAGNGDPNMPGDTADPDMPTSFYGTPTTPGLPLVGGNGDPDASGDVTMPGDPGTGTPPLDPATSRDGFAGSQPTVSFPGTPQSPGLPPAGGQVDSSASGAVTMPPGPHSGTAPLAPTTPGFAPLEPRIGHAPVPGTPDVVPLEERQPRVPDSGQQS
jgi:hypothetical protein